MNAPRKKAVPGTAPAVREVDYAAIAAQRLKHIGNLTGLRYLNCEHTPCLPGLLRVIANALKIRDGLPPSPDAIRSRVHAIDREGLSPEMLEAASKEAARDRKLISNERAGALVGLLAAEAWDLADEDIAVSIWPVDETAEEREHRRAARRREMAARRQARLKAKRKANVANIGNAAITSGVTKNCNIGQTDAVLAAIRGGASAPAEIAGATGLKITTVRPVLSRLLKAGKIISPSRGRYEAAAAEPPQAIAPAAPMEGVERAALAMGIFIERLTALSAPVALLSARIGALAHPSISTLMIRRPTWPAAA